MSSRDAPRRRERRRKCEGVSFRLVCAKTIRQAGIRGAERRHAALRSELAAVRLAVLLVVGLSTRSTMSAFALLGAATTSRAASWVARERRRRSRLCQLRRVVGRAWAPV